MKAPTPFWIGRENQHLCWQCLDWGSHTRPTDTCCNALIAIVTAGFVVVVVHELHHQESENGTRARFRRPEKTGGAVCVLLAGLVLDLRTVQALLYSLAPWLGAIALPCTSRALSIFCRPRNPSIFIPRRTSRRYARFPPRHHRRLCKAARESTGAELIDFCHLCARTRIESLLGNLFDLTRFRPARLPTTNIRGPGRVALSTYHPTRISRSPDPIQPGSA